MKQVAALLLAALLAFSLSACGGPPAESIPFDPAASLPPPPAESAVEALPPLPVADGVNPLTGLPLAEGAAPGRRPVAVMVANNEAALPQRGLVRADVLYEMLTEGGVTRLMAVYGDATALPTVGPVRSTRDQFVQFAYPLQAVLVHIGGSVYARNLLEYLDYPTVDGIYLGTTAFGFDTARAATKSNEYCWFTDAAPLQAGMAAGGIPADGEVPLLFRFAEKPAQVNTEAYRVRVVFSQASACTFSYSEKSGVYGKRVFGQPHKDESGETLGFENLLLLYCPITRKADSPLPEFDLRGGAGYYCNDGGVQPITWQKGAPQQPLRLLNAEGEELELQPGKTYVGILPEGGQDAVTFTSRQQLEAGAAAESTPEMEPLPPAEP